MAWLPSWTYRRWVKIFGSTAGVQTDYQMPSTRVYKYGCPLVTNGVSRPIQPLNFPNAYYYNGKTYVVWQGPDLDPYIDCYTHSTESWHGPVKVGTNPLVGDYHGSPVVVVDDLGYIHVFFGAHLTTIKHSRSFNPEDLSIMSSMVDIGITHTYPKVIKDSSGKIYLFCRVTNFDEALRTSDDNFVTSDKIIDNTDITYAGPPAYDEANGRIHLCWTGWTGAQNENIYHAYYKISDGHLYKMDGTDLGTQIAGAEIVSCKIVTFNDVAYESFVELDPNGYPHVFYIKNIGGLRQLTHIYWNGGSWSSENVIRASTRGFGGVFITAVNDIVMYTGSGADTILKYQWDGTSWSQIGSIDAAQYGNGFYGLYHKVPNYQDELRVLVADFDDADFTHADLPVYGLNSADELVCGYAKVDCNNHCEDDFSDIRFTASDGQKELDYWIEDYVLGKWADVWIEVDSIVADPGTTTIYIYYGNFGVAAGSNIKATALIGDDFEDGVIDAGLWGTITGCTEAGGKMTVMKVGGVGGVLVGANYFTLPLRIFAYFKTSVNNMGGLYAVNVGSSDYVRKYDNVGGGQWRVHTRNDGVGTTQDFGTSDIVYHLWEILIYAGHAKYYLDHDLVHDETNDIPDEDLTAALQSPDVNGEYVEFEYIFLSKYANPEPKWDGVGPEDQGLSIAQTNPATGVS